MPYPTPLDKQLIKAVTSLKNELEVQHFLRDLLTPAEIAEFAKRFEIAKQLWTTNKPYLEIAQKTKTSTTTVTRVAHWLYQAGLNGYKTVLKRLFGTGTVR